MKKSILSLAFLVVLATSLFSTEIEGFREFKWGCAPTSANFQISGVEDREKKSTYKLGNENFNIGDVTLSSITYNFFDNKLFNITMFEKGGGYKTFLSLIETFKAKYGNGKKDDILGYKYIWKTDKGYINIQYDSIRDYTAVTMIGNKFFDEFIVYKKQLAKQSANDL